MISRGRSGRASWTAGRAVSRSASGGGGDEDCSGTSPGGEKGEGERKKRTPAPASARQASMSAARRSSINPNCGLLLLLSYQCNGDITNNLQTLRADLVDRVFRRMPIRIIK